MPPFTEFLLIFAAGLAGMFGIYELLDGNNDEPTDEEPATPDPVEGDAPLVEDLVLGDRATIAGDADNNTLTGTDDAERIEGGDGDDTITGGGGDDQILAGAGDDVVTATGTVFGEAGNDTLTSGEADTTLVGGEGNDTLSTDNGATLFGGTGDDILIVNGAASASGGAGNDLFVASVDADDAGVFTISDFDPTQDNLAFDLAAGEVVTDISSTPLDGEAEGQTISVTIEQSDGSGTPRVELVQLTGVTDQTVLDSLQTRDADGNLADLSVSGVINGTDAADTLDGGDGDDVINALDGDDAVSGGLGANTVNLGAGNDTYTGGGNAENVQGGDGDDTITDVAPTTGEVGSIRFDGGAGNDNLTAERSAATLLGGAGDDTLTLGDEGGRAEGGEDADTLIGGDGDDQFLLDEQDTVTGGAGDDVFELVADADAADADVTTITDYVEGEDLIRIVVPLADDVVAVQDAPGAAGQPDNAIILVNGDEVAIVTGAGGLALEDISVTVATA